MSPNEGRAERIIRLFISAVCFGIAFFHVVTGGLAIAAYVISALAFVTAVVGYCPAWTVFGIDTRGVKHIPVRTGGSGQ